MISKFLSIDYSLYTIQLRENHENQRNNQKQNSIPVDRIKNTDSMFYCLRGNVQRLVYKVGDYENHLAKHK